jgi:D-alanyl-D-alanine carboxypeptidase/D-alanyl-D-alanine-endopeptidase (penicillin-binding protein 4)
MTWGVSIDGLLMMDGSGLSRDNRITCATLQQVLQQSGADGPLARALPVAGLSGTLSDVFVGSPVEARMQAKTGTLTDVKALAGYLPVVGGGTIEFTLVQNAPGVDQGAYLSVWDQLATALASYPAGLTEATLAPR